MNAFDLEKVDRQRPVHFIGIGGVSMSALALILKHHGFSVTGSDFKDGAHLDKLRSAGIDVAIGHSAENVGKPGLVVYTAAIASDNSELVYARTLGVPVVERPVLLGALMKRFRYPVSVAGTHGKTTTTSMLAQVFMKAALDPTVLVGGDLPAIGGNLREGGNEYMVMEACEYCASFLNFFPYLAVILNIEEDHLDFFRDLDDIVDCFAKFAALVPRNGYVVANADSAQVKKCVENASCNIVTYGLDSFADYTAKDVLFNDMGHGSFEVMEGRTSLGRVQLSVPGMHNVSNALAVIAASRVFGLEMEVISAGLAAFTGTDRRFQYKGEADGLRIVDDYAHHPTEVAATLDSASRLQCNRLWCVFQPHTYTRAYKLMDQFADCFGGCHEVIVADIYAAREKDTGLVHASQLAEAIAEKSGNARYIGPLADVANYLREQAEPGDVVLTLGAGDVYKVGEMLLESGK